jgi:hypothetical protein
MRYMYIDSIHYIIYVSRARDSKAIKLLGSPIGGV